MLCPIIAALPYGLAIVMRRAAPLSEAEKDYLIETDGFPDWVTFHPMTQHLSSTRHRIGGDLRGGLLHWIILHRPLTKSGQRVFRVAGVEQAN